MHADPPILFQNAILTLYGHISHQINKTKKSLLKSLDKKRNGGFGKISGYPNIAKISRPLFFTFFFLFFLTIVFVVETTCIKFVLPLDQWYNCY